MHTAKILRCISIYIDVFKILQCTYQHCNACVINLYFTVFLNTDIL